MEMMKTRGVKTVRYEKLSHHFPYFIIHHSQHKIDHLRTGAKNAFEFLKEINMCELKKIER